MCSLPALLLILAIPLSAQTYTIQTIAGGGLPVNMPGLEASLGPISGVAVDGAGNVYMSLARSLMVVKLDTAGFLTEVAGQGPERSGDFAVGSLLNDLNLPLGLAVDASGGLYIADGSLNVLRISGGTTTIIGPPLPPLPAHPTLIKAVGVAVDASGAVYVADSRNHQIEKFANGTMTIVAGTGKAGYSGDQGPATAAQLNSPSSVAIDSSGNLYIADTLNNRIRKVSSGIIKTIAGTGAAGYGGDGGPATSAQLNAPWGVTVDASGNLYIADTLNSRIRELSNGIITTVAGTGAAGYGGDGGSAASAQLHYPSTVAVDGAGNLYIADAWNFRLRKVTQGVITTLAGNGTELGDGGPATNAQLFSPGGVAVDADANLYISDDTALIRRVSGGVVTTFAAASLQATAPLYPVAWTFGFFGPPPAPVIQSSFGTSVGGALAVDSDDALYVAWGECVEELTGSVGTAVDDTCGAPNDFVRIGAIAFDKSGNLYIADADNHRVHELSNGTLSTFAGNGTAGYSGDGGPATSAELYLPSALAVDSKGDVYIADLANNAGIIRKVSGGVINTIAGGGTTLGDGGPATNALLSVPPGLALDESGNLYVSDSGNDRVRKISNGIIRTIAGNGVSGFSGDGGPAASAQLSMPERIAVDAQGNVYVADSGNNRVRVLTPTGSGSAGNNSAPACSYSLGASGQFVPAAGGSFTVSVTAPAGCPWGTTVAPDWVNISALPSFCALACDIVVFNPGPPAPPEPLYGSGAGLLSVTVPANTGAPRTATITIAGQTFTMNQEGTAASGPALPFLGSMAQIAPGNGWDTSITLVNTGTTAADAALSFFGDNGAALPLPVTIDPALVAAPQQPQQSPPLVSTLTDTLNPHAMTELDISDPSVLVLGSAQLAGGGTVTGFGVFTYLPTGQAAVAPLETRNASSYLLPFDNTGTLQTGLAIANLSSAQTGVSLIVRDNSGAQIGTGQMTLPAMGHESFMLQQGLDGLSVTAGKRGTIEFDTASGGQVSVLGLRANGNAITSLPVLTKVGTASGMFPHIAVGGDWETLFTFVNTDTAASSFRLAFYDDNGAPLPVNLSVVLPGGTTTSAAGTGSVSQALPAGASVIVEASGAAVQAGSAQFFGTGDISGFAVFHNVSSGQEASVSLNTGCAASCTLAFDDTNGLATGVGLANGSTSAAAIRAVLRDQTGNIVTSKILDLPANGHTAEMLIGWFPAAQNIRGTVEFDAPAGGLIGAAGIRSTPAGAFTIIPVIAQ
jgi:sugar lactone lactonase YvrE